MEAARHSAPNLVKIEVEAETLGQLKACLDLPDVDGVLLDNMTLDQMREAVALRDRSGRRFFLEASGNLTLDRARAVAEPLSGSRTWAPVRAAGRPEYDSAASPTEPFAGAASSGLLYRPCRPDRRGPRPWRGT